MAGDWDGSGKSKIGEFSEGRWYLDYNGNRTWDGVGPAGGGVALDRVLIFGRSGDKPVVGKRWR